ncbi:hypothetical protein ACKFKG_19290 [Phormidesmis sp. 146-35]
MIHKFFAFWNPKNLKFGWHCSTGFGPTFKRISEESFRCKVSCDDRLQYIAHYKSGCDRAQVREFRRLLDAGEAVSAID